MKRGRPKLKIGIKEFPFIMKERIKDPNISLKKLRAKYGNLRVLNTSYYLDICMTRINHPEYTLQQIANSLALNDREYPRLVLKQMKLPTKHKGFGYLMVCPICGKRKTSESKYCRKCREYLLYEFVYCEECHIPIRRRIKHNLYMKEKRGYKHTWCSKKCQGKWLGKNHKSRQISND